MGWSCMKAAMDTQQKIFKALCIGKSQNVFQIKGTVYMVETFPVEHDDGAITGTIYNLTNWTGRPCNSFRINPEGKVERGPQAFLLAADGKPIPGLQVPPADM